MTIIRARQPAITRILPHQGNRRILIGNRFPPEMAQALAPKPVSTVYSTTTAVITFDSEIFDVLATDFAATVNLLPNAVVSAVKTDLAEVTVTWTTPGVSTNAVDIDYTRGSMKGSLLDSLVATFQESGVIP